MLTMESLLASPSSSLSPPAASLGSRGSRVSGGIASGFRQKKKRQLMKTRRDMGRSFSSLNSPSSSAFSLYSSSRSRHNARWWWFQEGNGISRTTSEFTAAAAAAGAAEEAGDDGDGETEKAEKKDKRKQRGSAEEGLVEQYPAKAGESRGNGRGGLENTIPESPEQLIKCVSSSGYDIRRQLKQTIESIGYDVLESNPWREPSKPVYVLTHKENQLCTMKTRRTRSEVERELGLLFSKKKSDTGKPAKHSTKFHMLVEDIREGILVFEDEKDAEIYCDLLQGGRGCEGIAEIEASSVFDICRKMKALAVLFRRGRVPPLPETLELNLKARNRSLEDN